MKKFSVILALLLTICSLFFFSSTILLNRSKISTSFPGYLTLKNGMVGPFYLNHWSGHQKGFTYHAVPDQKSVEVYNEIFTTSDFISIVVLPAVTGLLFFFLGLGLSFYLPQGPERLPLLFFHFLAGNYLILSGDFHLSHHFSNVVLSFFVFIPAVMIHFGLVFPHRSRFILKFPIFFFVPYFIAAALSVPYIYQFKMNPTLWIQWERIIVYWIIAAYTFWIFLLSLNLKRPPLELKRIVGRYFLFGQFFAFLPVLVITLGIFFAGATLPLNHLIPLLLLFPISLFLGVILAKLKQSQMQLLLVEKRAALGTLLGGLAHEINNPLTFIYSNIGPLKELLGCIEKGEKKWDEVLPIIQDIEEGAVRTKNLIDHFQNFLHPERLIKQKTDLNLVLEQSIVLLKPKWNSRIKVIEQLEILPEVIASPVELGQVFVNILGNAIDAIEKDGVILVSTRKENQFVCISIEDTGHGMHPDEIHRIFDPFFTTKPEGKGTGLGLAIVAEILKRNNAKIEVRSGLGRGTEVVVLWPIE